MTVSVANKSKIYSQNWVEIINRKLLEVNGFNNPINNIEQFSRFFTKKTEKLKMKPNKMKSFIRFSTTTDSLNTIGSTSTSKTLNKIGFGFLVVPVTAGAFCGIAIGSELAKEVLKEKEKDYMEEKTLSINSVQTLGNVVRRFRGY